MSLAFVMEKCYLCRKLLFITINLFVNNTDDKV